MTADAKPRAGRYPLGVVIVDPQHVVRSGLSLLVAAEPDMAVMAEAGSADEALHELQGLRRKSHVVVLVGLGLTGPHNGLWLLRTIRETFPSLRVLGCGINGDKTIVAQTLFAGADGYVDKGSHPASFLDALRRAAGGETVLDGLPVDVLGPVAEALEERRELEPAVTERERSVLSLAAEGLTARQIGSSLGVKERTVTTHLGHIYRKLGVSSRIAAVNAAASLALLPGMTART